MDYIKSALGLDTGRAAMELADLRIIAAMLEEALLGLRIALYDTEIDWLTITAGGLDTAAVAAIDRRLTERLQGLKATEADVTEWVTAVQGVIVWAVRTQREQLPDGEQRARGNCSS